MSQSFDWKSSETLGHYQPTPIGEGCVAHTFETGFAFEMSLNAEDRFLG